MVVGHLGAGVEELVGDRARLRVARRIGQPVPAHVWWRRGRHRRRRHGCRRGRRGRGRRCRRGRLRALRLGEQDEEVGVVLLEQGLDHAPLARRRVQAIDRDAAPLGRGREGVQDHRVGHQQRGDENDEEGPERLLQVGDPRPQLRPRQVAEPVEQPRPERPGRSRLCTRPELAGRSSGWVGRGLLRAGGRSRSRCGALLPAKHRCHSLVTRRPARQPPSGALARERSGPHTYRDARGRRKSRREPKRTSRRPRRGRTGREISVSRDAFLIARASL